MDVTISTTGPDFVAEELRSLFSWLAKDEEFRGRVRLMETMPASGTLGGWPEAVVVTLGQGGALTVLASAVISWIRHRTSDVTCTLKRPDGTSVELMATRIRGADLSEVGELVEQVGAVLSDTDDGHEGSR